MSDKPEEQPEGEEWAQVGINTPEGTPPKGVTSPKDPPPPNITGPNFIPPDPLPEPSVAPEPAAPADPEHLMQHQPEPTEEPEV